jgi:uncharacterized protein
MSVVVDLTSFLRAAAGGALIGAAASLYLLVRGAPVGISGMVEDALKKGEDRKDAVLFLAGLLTAGVVAGLFVPSMRSTAAVASLPVLALAGFLVGFGTRLGKGCTSGHGVCGLSRFSLRSLVATLTFMLVAVAVTFVMARLGRGQT